MTRRTALHEIADLIAQRAAGEWDALNGRWADEIEVWHCYDDVLLRIPSPRRASGASAELIALEEAIDGFSRRSVVHVSEDTNAVIETSRWSGRSAAGADMSNATCIVYTVAGDHIARMDIYDDSNRSRRIAELLVHHLIAKSVDP